MRPDPGLPKLGVGIVWWPELDPLCRPGEGLVQVIEVEPETFWIPEPGAPAEFTSRLAAAVAHLPHPKLLHGVGAPFGGTAGQSAPHRRTLANDIASLQPAWISDHLSFDRFCPAPAGGETPAVFTGFFMPPAQSVRGIAQAAGHIRHRRASTGVPVAFENAVSYLPPAPGEMPDGEYAAAVAEAADCGILLDLHNVLCNARNGRQSVRDFCESLPLERVWEIHLAGGAPERGFWLDAHSGVVEPELMEILAEIVPRLPSLGAITFEIVPEFVAATGLPAIADMLGRINDIWDRRATAPAAVQPAAAAPWRYCNVSGAVSPAVWEYALGASVTGLAPPDLPAEFAGWLREAEAPLALYAFLAQEGRASSLVISAPRTVRALLRSLGEIQTRALLAQFWRVASPAYTSAEEGRAFLTFIETVDVAVPGLGADIVADRDCMQKVLCV